MRKGIRKMVGSKNLAPSSVYLAAFKAAVQEPVVKHIESEGLLSLFFLTFPIQKSIFSIALDTSASQVR